MKNNSVCIFFFFLTFGLFTIDPPAPFSPQEVMPRYYCVSLTASGFWAAGDAPYL